MLFSFCRGSCYCTRPVPSPPLIIIVSIIIVLISLDTELSVQCDGRLGLGVAGRACGWVAGRAGFWGVLATWVRGWRLQPVGF